MSMRILSRAKLSFIVHIIKGSCHIYYVKGTLLKTDKSLAWSIEYTEIPIQNFTDLQVQGEEKSNNKIKKKIILQIFKLFVDTSLTRPNMDPP